MNETDRLILKCFSRWLNDAPYKNEDLITEITKALSPHSMDVGCEEDMVDDIKLITESYKKGYKAREEFEKELKEDGKLTQ